MLERLISTKRMIKRMEYADGYEIDQLLNALRKRYQRLYPDWEVLFISRPKQSQEEQHLEFLTYQNQSISP